MQIFWHGFSCVRIESSQGDVSSTLVTDPFESQASVRFPRTLKPSVVVLSHQDRKRFPLDVFEEKVPFLIAEPGEYEIGGAFIHGIVWKNGENKGPHRLLYRLEIEGISIGFLGGAPTPPPEAVLGALEDIDVLILPVGGGDRLNPKQAAEVVREVEPRMVIPIYYQIDGIKEKLATADQFCKEVGAAQRQDGNKLKLTRKDLPADELVVVVLERA